MGHIIKRVWKEGKPPRYYIRYKTPEGKWKQEAGGTRRKDAEALLRRRESEVADGSHGQQDDITFTEFSWKWLEDFASLKKPPTTSDYTGIVKKHLRPYFGKKLLKDIRPTDVQAYVSLKLKKGLAPRTINKTLTLLRLMFKHAIIWGYLNVDPARFVERPREEHKEMDFLSGDEVARLLVATPPEYYALFATAVMTGARQGELLALRWSDFDPEMGAIYIRRSYSPKHGFMEPKTKKGSRAVTISPELIEILSIHRDNTGGNPDDLIFSKDGNPIAGHNLVRDVFRPALNGAGLRRIRFHDLRHTYAALMISQDVNPKVLQDQMGHSSITTTMDRYGHLLPAAGEGSVKKLDALLFDKNVIHFPGKKKDN